jgi:TonB family protein
MSIVSRFFNMFRPRALERELDDEVSFHLDRRITANLQLGMEQPEAEQAALEQFGNVRRVKNGMREVHVINRRVVAAFALGLTIGAFVSGVVSHRHSLPPGPAFYRAGQEGASTPVLVREAKPTYTPEALRAKISGTVIIECVVQTSGTCDNVRVTKSLDPGLDREAINALQWWRFQPGQRLGKPVPVLVTIEMTFTLT